MANVFVCVGSWGRSRYITHCASHHFQTGYYDFHDLSKATSTFSTVYARRFTICSPVPPRPAPPRPDSPFTDVPFTIYPRFAIRSAPYRYHQDRRDVYMLEFQPTKKQTDKRTNKHAGWRGAAGNIYFIYSVAGQDCGINIRTGPSQVAKGSGHI